MESDTIVKEKAQYGNISGLAGLMMELSIERKLCHTELAYSGNTMNLWTRMECKHPIDPIVKDKTESSSDQPTMKVVVE